jgi:threonylcarbamoyladenosine tRNA methylthiotransferase MtaB
MKYAVITFGCRVNQADSLAFEEQLIARGGVATSADRADLVIVNTCSVTATADQGARQTIRRVARDNPAAKIVVTGCYATREHDAVSSLPNVSRVVSNDDKPRLIPLVATTTENAVARLGDGPCGAVLEPGVMGRTAYTLRVQTGCAEPCSYCIIPATRGAPQSTPPANVLAEIDRVAASGFKEIVLTGVHLGSYGRDLTPASSLVDLLRAIESRVRAAERWPVRLKADTTVERRPVRLKADTTAERWPVRLKADTTAEGPPRDVRSVRLQPDPPDASLRLQPDSPAPLFRISSLEPMDCTPEIVDLVARASIFAPHFHLPLQHASDGVLAAMRRPYTIDQYASLVDGIRRRIPHASIGTDVIVGFPGETDDDFAQLASYLERSPVTHVHVFPYSDRPGTAASRLRSKVHGTVIRDRARRIREIGAALAARFHATQIGTTHTALTLEDGTLAVTGNYLKVRIPPGRARNEWVRVKICADGRGDLVID